MAKNRKMSNTNAEALKMTCYTIQNNKGQDKVIHLADSPSDAQGRFQWSFGYWPAAVPQEITCTCKPFPVR